MTKTKAPKAAATVRKPMKAAERRRKIAAMCAEVTAFWKDTPDTGAEAHLISLRRAKA